MKYLTFLAFSIFLMSGVAPELVANETTALISTEERRVTPTQIYGQNNAPIALYLGNGGAGPTCLLQELSEDFIRHNELDIRIAWVQTITRLTLENLKEGVIDISLTYEEPLETAAIREGWATDRTLIFNDHFILAGPKSNPAKISPSDSIQEAFQKISQSQSAFFSRDDLSGTNERERAIWESINLSPWKEHPKWYIAKKVFPADNVKQADSDGLYTLTDRGTLLAMHGQINNTAVYIQRDENLMNRCHAMLQKSPSPYAKLFLKYLKSDRAQALIGSYSGKLEKNCQGCCPLFTKAKEDEFLDKKCLEKLGFN
jgi:tungstate transport system substrate-binding protein